MKRLAFAALCAFVGVMGILCLTSTNRITPPGLQHTRFAAAHSGICPTGWRFQWHWWFPHGTCEEQF
ncbi:MAG TPA: hypothetical protein VLZ05_23015 [Mycobacterium sp.]|nr:hypothetical protein [Mycobacterium sp.]HUH71498.1 hypothetical protein [Mycobacterium sp.]